MKKKLLTLGVAALFLASFVPGLAQATTTVEQMQTLLQQIKTLQDQIAELSKKQSEAFVQLKETAALVRELRLGMTSDDVKALQEILAADPEVYPEGLVTGFYGPLTEQAVKRFQKKHGLEQVGVVGPKTRAKMNALVSDGEFACKAWGKLIAPGQKKKIGNVSIDVSHCEKVPGGIWKKLTGDWWKNGTSTDDDDDDDDDDDNTTAPDIEDIDVTDISQNEATVAWETNEKAKGTVWYDDDNNVDLDPAMKESVTTYDDSHEVTLEDLEDETDYYFIIVVTDKDGNTATSSVQHFETGNTPADTTDPDIEDIDVNDIGTTSAEVAWETDEDASGIVWYDDDSSVDLDINMRESVSSFDTQHSVMLEGLGTSTDYYFIVVATDEAGNTSTSTTQHFVTD